MEMHFIDSYEERVESIPCGMQEQVGELPSTWDQQQRVDRR